MSREALDQETRVARCRGELTQCISQSEERDIAIWIAALISTLQRVSDWNLQGDGDSAERGERTSM